MNTHPTDQTEREALSLRYVEPQPDSGAHKPAMPGHIAVERGIEVVARLPIPDGLALSPTPHVVTTVAELRALDPKVAPAFITARGNVMETRTTRWHSDEILQDQALPATVLTPAPAPVDREALAEKVAEIIRASRVGVNGFFRDSPQDVARAVLDAIEEVSRG